MKKILTLLLIIVFVSCGTRKVEIDKAKEEIKVDSVATIKTESKQEIKNDVITTLEASEIMITAIDTTKPIVINNVPYFNAKIEMRKKKELIIDKTISNAESKTEAKVQKNVTSKKVVYAKVTERQSFQWYWLLLLLIPIGYYIYKKYPNKFSWLKKTLFNK
jgi:hypothetical protein